MPELDEEEVDIYGAPTLNVGVATLIGDDRCYNQSSKAGISDQGNTDYILFNDILHGGDGPGCGPNIDVTGSTNPQVFGNNPNNTASTASATRKHCSDRAVKRFSPGAHH